MATHKECINSNFVAPLKLRVENYKLNLELQFSKNLPNQTLKLQVTKVFNFKIATY